MQKALFGVLLFFFGMADLLRAQDRHHSPIPIPEQFEIGRRTFFDFGPPFDFYEIFIVRPQSSGTLVERALITPGGDKCFAPAKVETSQVIMSETIAILLDGKNPCAIPEKDLKHEQKRCKKCLVFSGADVVMQVQCGNETRLIRSAILDRDMFDPHANTPENTSWTMRLLGRIDKAVGPGVMDKPVFQSPESNPSPVAESPVMQDLADGKYDQLFPKAPDKPSALYRGAHLSHPAPQVQLIASSPVSPDVFIPPNYPRLAEATHTQGVVSFTLEIDGEGSSTNFVLLDGHPLLQAAVKDATAKWKFPKAAAGQHVQVSVEFKLNCDE